MAFPVPEHNKFELNNIQLFFLTGSFFFQPKSKNKFKHICVRIIQDQGQVRMGQIWTEKNQVERKSESRRHFKFIFLQINLN